MMMMMMMMVMMMMMMMMMLFRLKINTSGLNYSQSVLFIISFQFADC